MGQKSVPAQVRHGAKESEDVRKPLIRRELENMRDTLYVRGEFPCPRYLDVSDGLTVEHVKAWANRYLVKVSSPLLCLRVAACAELKYTQDRGVIGCWGLTLGHRDKTFIAAASPSVRHVAKKWGAEAFAGNTTGTAILRVQCKHSHNNAA